MSKVFTVSLTEINNLLKNGDVHAPDVFLVNSLTNVEGSIMANGWSYYKSLNPSWDLNNQVKALKSRGEWSVVAFEGNYRRNYFSGLRNENSINDLRKMSKKLLKGENIYLVCDCLSHRLCHRSLLAEFLTKHTGCQVEHLN